MDAFAYGLDFGYNNPSAIVRVSISDREVYVEERLYQTHMTNAQIIEFLSHEPKGDIYCDPTELQHIEEIKGAGYAAYPANKDVKLGIDLCKRQTLLITLDSANLLKEIQGYSYKKSKDGGVLDEPVKLRRPPGGRYALRRVRSGGPLRLCHGQTEGDRRAGVVFLDSSILLITLMINTYLTTIKNHRWYMLLCTLLQNHCKRALSRLHHTPPPL